MHRKQDRFAALDAALANPAPEVKAAMAAIGRQPGAVGDNEAGQLVRIRDDGTEEVIPEDRAARGQGRA